MVADIANGNVDAADVLFLIAAIVFGVAAILPHTRTRTAGAHIDFSLSLVPLGLCLVAIALLLL